MVCLAIPSESYQLIEDIGQQIEEYQGKPRRLLPNGEPTVDIHGFLEWLQGLKDGWAELPEVIPHEVLLAWRNGYANHPCRRPGEPCTPVPIRRCEDCRMVLPNATANDNGPCIIPCPVCGSEKIGHMNLGNWGTFRPPD